MFLSIHIKDVKKPKIDVEIVDECEMGGVSECDKHPFVIMLQGEHAGMNGYMRYEEAQEFATRLNQKLRDYEAEKLKSWK